MLVLPVWWNAGACSSVDQMCYPIRWRLIDMKMKYCEHCQHNVKPARAFSWLAFTLWAPLVDSETRCLSFTTGHRCTCCQQGHLLI